MKTYNTYTLPINHITDIMDLTLSVISLDTKQTIAYIDSLDSKEEKDIIIAIRIAHNLGLKGIR